MILKNLIELSDSKFDSEHKCNENEFKSDIRILHCIETEGQIQDTWHLHSFRFASSEDVKLGEGDYLNEVLNHSMVAINFCPFCGVKLDANKRI